MKLTRKNNNTTVLKHAQRVTVVCLIMASFILAIGLNIKFADAQHIELILQFGTSTVDSADDVFADSSGVYVAGFTDGTLPDQTSQGGRDAFIRKYNSDGDEMWTRQFGMSDFEDVPTDEANGVSADSSGVYVVGETQHSLAEGGLDAFIRKYNSDGDEMWTRQFGTSLQDNAFEVSADSSGVYVVGTTAGVFEGETNKGGFDAFIRKYNSDGDEMWTRQFGTSETSDSADDVFADSSGVYVVGTAGGSLPDQINEGSVDAFIRKYNSDGDEMWTRQFGTSSNDDATGVSVDSSGVYVAGVTDGTFPGESREGDFDIFARKYNSDGDKKWTRQFGTSDFDIAHGVSIDSSGVYVAGSTSGTLPDQTSQGDVDAFLAKLAIDDDKKKDHHDDDNDAKKHHDDGDGAKKKD